MLLGQVDADDVQTRRVDAQQRAAFALAGGVDVETVLADQPSSSMLLATPDIATRESPVCRPRSARDSCPFGNSSPNTRERLLRRTSAGLASSSCRACAGGTRWCWRTRSLVQSFLVRAPMIRIMRAAVWSCSNPQSLYYSNRRGDSGTINAEEWRFVIYVTIINK